MGVKTYVSLLAALVGLPLAVDATEPERSTRSDECVVLLHGLARTAGAMKPVEKALAKVGYTVHNIGYASRKGTIETLAEDAVSRGVSECRAQDASTIHFVTHSMGGILVRYYLSKHSIPKLGHVVMMAPPNQGSEVVDDWSDRPGFALLNGPAGMQLGTDDDSIPSKLGPVDFSLGIIAGTATMNPILSRSLPNPDDGKVSVASTKVEGMTDFVAVPYTHTFLMRRSEVHDEIIHFLQKGRFAKLDDPADH